MNSQDANRIRGLMSVLDSELEGSRRMIGAMLIQSFAEMLDAESASKIVEEIGASLVRACQIIQAELDEPAPDSEESDEPPFGDWQCLPAMGDEPRNYGPYSMTGE